MRVRAPIGLLALALVASGALLLSYASNLTFVGDGWELLAGRPDWTAATFLRPFNEHPIMLVGPRLQGAFGAVRNGFGAPLLPRLDLAVPPLGRPALRLHAPARRRLGCARRNGPHPLHGRRLRRPPLGVPDVLLRLDGGRPGSASCTRPRRQLRRQGRVSAAGGRERQLRASASHSSSRSLQRWRWAQSPAGAAPTWSWYRSLSTRSGGSAPGTRPDTGSGPATFPISPATCSMRQPRESLRFSDSSRSRESGGRHCLLRSWR